MKTSFKDDVTGESLFDYQVYLFFLPVFWATSVLANVHGGSPNDFLMWSLANVLAMTVCWLLIVLVDKTVFSNRAIKPANLLAVMVFALVIGALKGYLTTYLAWVFQVEENLDALVGRTLQAALLGLVTMPALAMLSATRRKFQEERQALISERVHRAIAEGDPLVGSSQRELQELRDSLRDLKLKVDNSGEVPPLLHEVVRLSLRPITHKLWDREDSRERSYTFRGLARLALGHYPFVGLPVALIVGLGSVIPYIASAGVVEGLLRAGLSGVLIFGIYWLAARVNFSKFFLSVGYFVLVNVLVAWAIVFASKTFFGELSEFSELSAGAVLFIWIIQTGFMSSFFKGVMITRSEIRAQLEETSKKMGIDDEVHRSTSLIAKRELANHLHANVQNKLLLLALRLERGDEVSVRDELGAIERLLDERIPASDAFTLEELVRRWAGLAEISIDVQVSPVPSVLPKLVSEAINNSVRHGLAQNIWVSVTSVDGDISVVIRDDGIGPKSGRPGLGSKFYDSIAKAGWTLKALPSGGAELRLLLK